MRAPLRILNMKKSGSRYVLPNLPWVCLLTGLIVLTYYMDPSIVAFEWCDRKPYCPFVSWFVSTRRINRRFKARLVSPPLSLSYRVLHSYVITLTRIAFIYSAELKVHLKAIPEMRLPLAHSYGHSLRSCKASYSASNKQAHVLSW